MNGVQHLPAFVLASAVVIVTPGPATLYVATRARISLLRATRAILGIVSGDLAMITLAALGVSAILARVPALLGTLQCLGAGYLIYLGVGMIRPASGNNATGNTKGGDYTRALMLTLTNPKPVLFFAAFFPQFIDGRPAHYALGFTSLSLIFEAINLTYFAGISLLVYRTGQLVAPGTTLQRRLAQAGGMAFLACGVGLLLTSYRLVA